MSSVKFLIDTNVVIGLEDHHQVESSLSEFSRKCSEQGIRKFVDGAAYDDVSRYTNQQRRAITLSKLDKFERLRGLPKLSEAELEQSFGPINSANDRSDARMLQALKVGAADFLISQDIDLHKRAGRAGLGSTTFTVEDALQWLKQTFDAENVSLPFITNRKAYEIDRGEEIFDSLREGYPGFDNWFEEKCIKEHRDCWVVEVEDRLAGIIIRKDENHSEADTRHIGPKILKICTFKMAPDFRGEKFGEQLLKQVLWFAQRNGYDAVYLTAYEDQDVLIQLLYLYGFEETGKLPNGELVIEKVIEKGSMPECDDKDYLRHHRRYYPRFSDNEDVGKFCVPIQSDYHSKLFPEIAFAAEMPLFPEIQFGRRNIGREPGDRTPGNTIRKVYLCRANSRAFKPGDLFFFYMSKDEKRAASQSITSVGVVEQINIASTLDDLLRLTAKRSVFSADELEEMIEAKPSPVKVIDFLLAGHFEPEIPLQTLLDDKVFSARPP